MYFPDVPDALGVPGVPRIPAAIIGQVTQGLGGASRLMSNVVGAIAFNPLAALSTIAPQVTDATALVGGVASTLGLYPSSLFDPFEGPVAGIQDTLGALGDAIAFNPSGPVGDVAGLAGVASAQLDDATGEYADAVDAVTGEPTLDADGVESVTVTGYKSDVSWGIVKDGKPVIQGDNFVSLEYKKDFVISDYQIEEGGFASYNKVTMPFDARLAVSCGGSVSKRATFLESIKKIAGDLLLYDVVMPEDTLPSVNVQHVDFKRTNLNGVGLITVYIYVLEIRETGEAAFATAAGPASPTATKSPAGAATQSAGAVQTRPPTPTQASKINDAINAVVPGL